MPAPERRTARARRPFHDDEARSLEMLNEPATIRAMISGESRVRMRPRRQRANASALATTSGEAGLSSADSGMPTLTQRDAKRTQR